MKRNRTTRPANRERGAAAILAMMFLVIFGSLAAAMAIVAEGNLSTADAHMKINRSLAGSETGLRWLIYRISLITKDVKTKDGLISGEPGGNAEQLWSDVVDLALDAAYENSFVNEPHNIEAPYAVGDTLFLGPIAVAPNAPAFTATLTPHPLTGEDYDGAYYQRPPYTDMDPAVSNAAPLDATWVRIRVQAADGPPGKEVYRAIQMDFRLEKKIPFAILSKSRVMIGRNVMIQGPIGSRFMETNLTNGHPIQMVSDFRGLDPALDANLDLLIGTLVTNDMDGDNRLFMDNPSEVAGITDPGQYDANGDGYISGYDFFLSHYDANGDSAVSAVELDTDTNINAAQLMELIDTFGDPGRFGYNDGKISDLDRYAKVRGSLKIAADLDGWLNGAAGGTYQDFLQGQIAPKNGEEPLTFEADETSLYSFDPADFDVSPFKATAESSDDFATQVTTNAANYDAMDSSSPQPPGTTVFEAVPYGAAYPYDYYDRPVYENYTFSNVKIPKGTNALFKNCKFIGVTFVETETANFLPHPEDASLNAYNYAGMQEADGSPKHPDIDNAVGNSKSTGNNIRFDNCDFEGAVISDSPERFTHVRNKMMYTGTTRFILETSSNLTQEEKDLYKRSTILAPHYSIEMGTFINPTDPGEALELSGTLVAGLVDLRGQVKVNGTILTTFEPVSNEGPVIGDTSPQFNTTLGYFPSSQGDLEAELPTTGVGVVQIRYDPTIPLPDGILGPIQITPTMSTYFETAAQ